MFIDNEVLNIKNLNEYFNEVIRAHEELYLLKVNNDNLNEYKKNASVFTLFKIRMIKLFQLFMVLFLIGYLYYFYVYVIKMIFYYFNNFNNFMMLKIKKFIN